MNWFIILILVVLAVLLGPFVTIWSLNTLFPVLDIPYSLDTWCAIILLGLFLRANVKVDK